VGFADVLFLMKYLAVALGLACAAASAAPQIPAPGPGPVLAVDDLRQALQQYHRDSSATPRQLTPVERAELRRQLSDYGQPPVQRGPRR